jgi:hypothetical protein
MKTSEAKEYIKELIISELSEVDADKTRGTVVMPKATNPGEVKKLTDQGVDVELKEEEETELTDKDIVVDPNDPIVKLQSKYTDIVKQMQSVLNQYKSAEGTKKQEYVDQLRDLTNTKKELLALINPSMDDEDEE